MNSGQVARGRLSNLDVGAPEAMRRDAEFDLVCHTVSRRSIGAWGRRRRHRASRDPDGGGTRRKGSRFPGRMAVLAESWRRTRSVRCRF